MNHFSRLVFWEGRGRLARSQPGMIPALSVLLLGVLPPGELQPPLLSQPSLPAGESLAHAPTRHPPPPRQTVSRDPHSNLVDRNSWYSALCLPADPLPRFPCKKRDSGQLSFANERSKRGVRVTGSSTHWLLYKWRLLLIFGSWSTLTAADHGARGRSEVDMGRTGESCRF